VAQIITKPANLWRVMPWDIGFFLSTCGSRLERAYHGGARVTGEFEWRARPTFAAMLLRPLRRARARDHASGVVTRPAGLEPATPGLEGRCSIQLSYGRIGRCLARRTCTQECQVGAPQIEQGPNGIS
jgi:hypothetical protein